MPILFEAVARLLLPFCFRLNILAVAGVALTGAFAIIWVAPALNTIVSFGAVIFFYNLPWPVVLRITHTDQKTSPCLQVEILNALARNEPRICEPKPFLIHNTEISLYQR